MNKTTIEWVKNPDGTQGYTWNPITGCLNGCEYCYARKLANGRLRSRYLHNLNILNPNDLPLYLWQNPFYPRFWEERLRELDPIWKGKHFTVGGASKVQPKGIFVCDMSDLFGISIPEKWTRQIFDIIKINSGHRFYLLTKQPQNLPQFSPFPKNVWLGVSATDDGKMVEALWALREIEAKVKYISLEPFLDLQYPYYARIFSMLKYIQWVIIGSQTKPYKPPKIEWVEEIVRACDKAGIPVFLKENLMPLFNFPVPRLFGKKFPAGRLELRQEMPNGR